MTVELDLTGNGLWVPWKTYEVVASKPSEEMFPVELQARWLHVTAAKDTKATVTLRYE